MPARRGPRTRGIQSAQGIGIGQDAGLQPDVLLEPAQRAQRARVQHIGRLRQIAQGMQPLADRQGLLALRAVIDRLIQVQGGRRLEVAADGAQGMGFHVGRKALAPPSCPTAAAASPGR